MLYEQDKYEINLCHLTYDNFSNWKSEEMDIILESVDDLPAHLIPLKKNHLKIIKEDIVHHLRKLRIL
jgi:hypothetical protein